MYLCEHIGLSEHVKRDLKAPLFLVKTLLRITYPSATGVLAVSAGAARDLAKLAGIPQRKVRFIYNPVVNAELPSTSRTSDVRLRASLWGGQFRIHILTVGSLKAQKNHRVLLRAFAGVARDLDAALVILGEGKLRAVLEQDIEDLGLHGRVVMPGFHADPGPWFLQSDLFVLSSDFEGFANVVAEALSYGTPTVSTNCPHGPAEILDNGLYGELVKVNNADALAAGIKKALNRKWNREDLQSRALDFSISGQARAYLDLFSV
jgi:glycosyltransferase involved in cell wall biosynthesis